MGGSSVPSSTQAYQQVATGIWGSPEATALAKPILKPALASIKNQQDMLMGLQQGDPAQARKFFGLPETASVADISEQMSSHMRGPKIAMPSTPQQEQQAQQPKNYTRMAAEGGLMSLDDDGPKDPRKFAKGGDSAPKDITTQQANTMARWQQQGRITPAQQRQIDSWTQQRQTYQNYQKDKTGVFDAARQAGLTPAGAYLGQAGYFGGAYDPATKTFSVTNPYYNQAINVLQGMNQQPQQFQQATQAYQDALGGLKSAAGYTPQQVIAQQIEAAKIARGDIRDVAAKMADVERMQGGPNVQAVMSQAEQMAGPGSWTDAGVSQKYMSPYMQDVVDIQKREANRDFAKQMAALDYKAAGQGAYGGSRQAIERSESRRNQAQRLGDIQAQGLQQAYQSGMGQYGAESQLGQAARQANLSAAMQSILANQQAGMTSQQLNQLYGQGGFQTQAANQAAQNLAANNYVQQQLTAEGMNQGMDWNTASQNANMIMQARVANQNAALQAAMANQSAGLQANQQALGAYGQMAGIGQGLGSLGTQVGGYGQNLANLWGQAGGVLQGLGQGYFNQAQQNAANVWGGPATLAGQGIGILGGMGGGQSGVAAQTGQNVR
jgi:hypothetical protein